jgi:hypothetical protein
MRMMLVTQKMPSYYYFFYRMSYYYLNFQNPEFQEDSGEVIGEGLLFLSTVSQKGNKESDTLYMIHLPWSELQKKSKFSFCVCSCQVNFPNHLKSAGLNNNHFRKGSNMGLSAIVWMGRLFTLLRASPPPTFSLSPLKKNFSLSLFFFEIITLY